MRRRVLVVDGVGGIDGEAPLEAGLALFPRVSFDGLDEEGDGRTQARTGLERRRLGLGFERRFDAATRELARLLYEPDAEHARKVALGVFDSVTQMLKR